MRKGDSNDAGVAGGRAGGAGRNKKRSEKRLPLRTHDEGSAGNGRVSKGSAAGEGGVASLNGDVLYVEPRRQNDNGSKAASASKTVRDKSC